MSQRFESSNGRLLPALLVMCVLVIAAGYYLFHKPVSPEFSLAAGTALWRIVSVYAIVTLAGAIGRSFGINLPGYMLGTSVLQAGMGLGVLSIFFLVFGSTVGINWISLIALPVIAGAALWKSILRWNIETFHALRAAWHKTGRFERVIAFLIGIILLSTLIVALAPPIKYDALMYHLVLPQQYINQGKITHIPWLVMTGMPQTTEMLFTLAAGWAGLPAAAVLGWAVGLLSIMGIIGFFDGAEVAVSKAGWVAAASLLAGETFAGSLSWAYVDWTSLLFGVCSLYFMRAWMKEGSQRYIVLTGLFAGLSFASKYTGGILALCCAVVVILHLISGKSSAGKPPVLHFVYFASAAFFFPAIWLLRNYLFTGNPVYPFFFPAAEMDMVRISVYQGAETFGKWWEGFALPIRATIWGVEAGEGYSVSIGPLLLMLALGNAAAIRNPDEDRKLNQQIVLTMVLAGWIFWAIGNRYSGYLIQTRMYYSIFPALAILAGLGWISLSRLQLSTARLSRVIGAVVLLALGLSTLNVLTITIQSDAIRVVTGVRSESEYLDSNLGWYAPAVREVQSLSKVGRSLFFYEPRGLACVPACDPDEILDQWKIYRMGNLEPDSVLNLWKQEGFHFVLLNIRGMAFLEEGLDSHHPPEEVKALRDVVKDLSVAGTFGESYIIYKIP